MRRMYFLAARNLSNDSILISAQSSTTRQTQKSLWSPRRYNSGDTGKLRFRAFIAVTSCAVSAALPAEDEFFGSERGKLGKERENNLYRSNVHGKAGKSRLFHRL